MKVSWNSGVRLRTIFRGTLLTATTWAFASDPAPSGKQVEACVKSETALVVFLRSQPNHCLHDNDCDGYYLFPKSCSQADVLPKPGIKAALQPQLLKLQEQVRIDCGKVWDKSPACAPIPFQARCVRYQCVDGNLLAPPKPAPVPASKPAPVLEQHYPYAVLRNSCAPWDGPAVAIYLTKTQVTSNEVPLPSITLNLWRNLPPSVNQPIPLQGELGLGTRCLGRNQCESAVAGTVTLTSYDESGAAGTYELKFKNGDVERGTFQARWQKIRQVCG